MRTLPSNNTPPSLNLHPKTTKHDSIFYKEYQQLGFIPISEHEQQEQEQITTPLSPRISRNTLFQMDHRVLPSASGSPTSIHSPRTILTEVPVSSGSMVPSLLDSDLTSPIPNDSNILEYVLLPTEKNLLGIGRFSTVYRGTLNTRSQSLMECAIKVIHSDPEAYENYETEVKIWTYLKTLEYHDSFVIQYYGTLSTNKLLFMELATGDLYSLVQKKKMEKKEVVDYAKQILNGISFLHNAGTQRVIHRDLKPQNILLTSDNKLKLSDFGTSFIIPSTQLFQYDRPGIGTLLYSPPETLLLENARYGIASDIYSFGCVLYYLLTKEEPFMKAKGRTLQIHAIQFGFFECGFNEVIESIPEVLEIARKCLRKDYEQRPTAQELLLAFDEMIRNK